MKRWSSLFVVPFPLLNPGFDYNDFCFSRKLSKATLHLTPFLSVFSKRVRGLNRGLNRVAGVPIGMSWTGNSIWRMYWV